MNKKKLVLAYSGGLDTSVILKWLANKGFEVICFVGNVGQRDDFNEVKRKAKESGASKVYIEDLRKEFVTDFIFPALWGGWRKAQGLPYGPEKALNLSSRNLRTRETFWKTWDTGPAHTVVLACQNGCYTGPWE